jgi:hypothetical protein
LHRFARIAGIAIVGGFALFALLLLGVRFIAFPRIEAHDTLMRRLSQLGHRSRSTRDMAGTAGIPSDRGLRVFDRARGARRRWSSSGRPDRRVDVAAFARAQGEGARDR